VTPERPASARDGFRAGILLVLLALFPLLTAFGPAGFVESDAARAPVTEPVLKAMAATAPPAVKPRGGILVDATTGTALWERDADAKLAMASTTKIMTALVAMDRGRLDQPIIARVGAAQLPGSSVAGLRAGEQLPLNEMLFALMLPSGNDAALAIASTLGGSTEGFVNLMNQRAEQMGLKNTHFVNPHGLDAPGHYTSPRDLAAMGRALLGVPYLAEVVSTKEHAVGAFRWRSSNALLFSRPDVTGIKTGTEDLAGQVLVASARQGDRRAIVVVMNSPDRWAETNVLLDMFFKSYTAVPVALPPSPFYRGLALRQAGPPQTVPLWQAGLYSATLRLGDSPSDLGMLDVELAGRPLGQIAVSRG
jgi:D-alanyl-D-alanine carboxypeptidase (penicillin-binding protein 5/6)